LVVVLYLVLGLVLITLGGEGLVRGAGRTAKMLGVPAVVIALTLVAFGTSTPELAVNVTAAGKDATDLALGNILGSNIANILLVLGLASLVRPVPVHLDLIRREAPFLVGLQLLLIVMVLDGRLGRFDGIALVAIAAIYVAVLVRAARQARLEGAEDPIDDKGKPRPLWFHIGMTVVGLAVLLVGAHWFVQGALELTTMLGLSERFVGLTVAAIGTSLPELASALIASLRRQPDLAIGNAVGSCIFNLVVVLGVTVTVNPMQVDPGFRDGIGVDLCVAAGVAVVLWPIIWTGQRVARIEGALLLTGYVGWLVYLFFAQ